MFLLSKDCSSKLSHYKKKRAGCDVSHGELPITCSTPLNAVIEELRWNEVKERGLTLQRRATL